VCSAEEGKMDCLQFSQWLENRDTFDVSEADKAQKHTAVCQECRAKLTFDEKLDEAIFSAMKEVDLPKGFAGKIDLSLDRVMVSSPRKKYGLYGMFSAVIAVIMVVAVSFTLAPTPSISSMDELGRYVITDHGHHDDSVLVVENPLELEQLGDLAIPYESVKKELPESYSFVGARICPLGECESVHLVYLDNGRRISVYLVKNKDVGFSLSPGKQYTMSSENQTVSFWKKGGYVFARIG